MTKKIEEYLKYYIGCRVFDESVYNDLTPELLAWVIKQNRADELKPILRPLADMTEEEAGWVWCYSFELGLTTQLGTFFDYDIDKVKHENEICSLIIKRTDRPHHAVNIDLNGTSIVYNDEDISKPPIFCWRCHNGSAQFHYLLSRGFDLFGLIDGNLAIDKTKLP